MPLFMMPFTRKIKDGPKMISFFRTMTIKLSAKATKEADDFLNDITLPLVWCPSEAHKLILGFQRCEYEILSDPHMTRFVDANQERWQSAMYRHNQEYKNLYECMMTLKMLYKKRVSREKDHCGELMLCCKINFGWAKLSETFEPYVIRYFNESDRGKKDKSKKGRLEELEQRIADQEKIRLRMQNNGLAH